MGLPSPGKRCASRSMAYRMEHVYDVLKEVKAQYDGKFSVLEFGTNEGYAFVKIIYATKYLNMTDRVTVHGFDSFQGMPAPQGKKDLNLITDKEEWSKGQFEGNYHVLKQECARYYSNYLLHPGLFEDTLMQEFLDRLRTELPILVWIDSDYYSSARVVMERLLPFLPNGCVIYFDEYEWNYGSRYTGEARSCTKSIQERSGRILN